MKTARARWRARLVVLGALATVLGPAPALAEVDLPKVLVGKWEGLVQYEDNADRNRTLVIRSVKQRDGKWAAAGQFGITGKNLSKVDIAVEQAGGKVTIEFSTAGRSRFRLNLMNDKALVGTVTLASTSQRLRDRSVNLEKVP